MGLLAFLVNKITQRTNSFPQSNSNVLTMFLTQPGTTAIRLGNLYAPQYLATKWHFGATEVVPRPVRLPTGSPSPISMSSFSEIYFSLPVINRHSSLTKITPQRTMNERLQNLYQQIILGEQKNNIFFSSTHLHKTEGIYDIGTCTTRVRKFQISRRSS